MGFLARFRQGELRLTRIEAFSNGVSYLLGAAATRGSVDVGFVVYLLTPLFFIVSVARRSVAKADAARGA